MRLSMVSWQSTPRAFRLATLPACDAARRRSYGAFNHILSDLSIVINQFEELSAFSAGVERLSTFLGRMSREQAALLEASTSNSTSTSPLDSNLPSSSTSSSTSTSSLAERELEKVPLLARPVAAAQRGPTRHRRARECSTETCTSLPMHLCLMGGHWGHAR
jgi:hypothetical protein